MTQVNDVIAARLAQANLQQMPNGFKPIVSETDKTNTPVEALLLEILNDHAGARALCDTLERIADDLPGPPTLACATPVIEGLRSGFKRHIVLYERFLLPMLIERAEVDDNAGAFSAQVAAEHAAEECLAHDIADLLERALERGHVENAERLGYMLYCFFESRRRHLGWEEMVILPLAKRRLTTADWLSFPSGEHQ